MLTYERARELMESARDKYAGKPLQNNTRLYERGSSERPYYAVRLHQTDVVEIHPDGHYVLHTGGWNTMTTWNRIGGYAPTNRIQWWSREDGEKVVMCLPRASDPEPPWPERTIPRPFSCVDPGPEPVKSQDGCRVGERRATSAWSTTYVRPNELRATDRPAPYSSGRKVADAPTRARSVLAWLDAFDGRLVYVERWTTTVTDVGEESYRYNTGLKYEQCPHCKAFDALHSNWRLKLYGSKYGRGEVARRGWELHCNMMETFGTREAWQEAYITEFRAVREGREHYRAWKNRNSIPFFDGIELRRDGYPLRRVSEAYFKRERVLDRHERRMRREQEMRERLHRQVERARPRMLRAWRGSLPFEGQATLIAGDIAKLRENITTNGNEPEED